MAKADSMVIPVPEETLEEIWRQCCDLTEALGVAVKEMSNGLDDQEVSGTILAGVDAKRKEASNVLYTLTGLLERETRSQTPTAPADDPDEDEETERPNKRRAFTPHEVHSNLTHVSQIFAALKSICDEAIGEDDLLPAVIAAEQMSHRGYELVQPILDWGIAPEGGAK